MFSCKEVSILMSAALDRKLSRVEWFKTRLHLLFCKACRTFARQMTTLKMATQHLVSHKEDSADTPTLSTTARKRIATMLHQCEHNDKPKS